jgi:hypothetical protein
MRISFTLVFFFIISIAYSQDLRIEAGYSNLYSKQFDQLIKTYNFSRPFLKEKQPLLNHGFHSGLSYIFKSEKALKSGISTDYSLVRSRAENENLDLKLNFQLLQVGYLLQYQNEKRFGNFYSELGLNAAFGFLNKRQNNETYIIDDIKVKSFQAGVSLNLKIGHSFELSDNFKVSPFIGFHYSPYFTEGQSEIVIDQTSDLINEEEQYNSFLRFDVGIRFSISNKKVANNK